MKKIISVILSVIILLSCVSVFAEGEIRITVNGEVLELPKAPVIVDGVTYAPGLALAKAMGADIAVNFGGQALIGKDEMKITLGYGVYKFTAADADELWYKIRTNRNEGYVELEDGLVMDNGRPLIPVRAVCELMGLTVNWNSGANTVEITGDPAYIAAKNSDMGWKWLITDDRKTVTLSVDNKGFYKDTEAISHYVSQMLYERMDSFYSVIAITNEDNYHFDVEFICCSDVDIAALVEAIKSRENIDAEHYVLGLPLTSVAGAEFDITYTESPLEW